MARETECPICNAYVPIDSDVKKGDFIYCSYCGAQLLVKEIRDSGEDDQGSEVEEEWG